jgi:hypothetical protein
MDLWVKGDYLKGAKVTWQSLFAQTIWMFFKTPDVHGRRPGMKAIFGILFVGCLALGLYFLIKNPHWMMDPEHASALGIGAVLGFLLGRLFP